MVVVVRRSCLGNVSDGVVVTAFKELVCHRFLLAVRPVLDVTSLFFIVWEATINP